MIWQSESIKKWADIFFLMCQKMTEILKSNIPHIETKGICIFLFLKSLHHSRNLEEFQSNRVSWRLWTLRHLGSTITQRKCIFWSDKSTFFFSSSWRKKADHQQHFQKSGPVTVWGLSVPLAKVFYTSVLTTLTQKNTFRFSILCFIQEKNGTK